MVVNFGDGWPDSVTVTWPAGDQSSVHTRIVNPAAWPGWTLLAERVIAMQICGVPFVATARVAVGVGATVGVVLWAGLAGSELDADALDERVGSVADGEGDGV